MALIDGVLTYEQTVDPAACNEGPEKYNTVSRDPARTPFPWDDTTNAGFSKASKTWLPLAPDWKTNNVKAQEAATISHLKIFRQLTNLRKTSKTLQLGGFESVVNGNILIYKRELADNDPYVVVLNLSPESRSIDLTQFETPAMKDKKLKVVVTSLQSGYAVG